MSTIKKFNSQKQLKKIDWKNFFDVRVFLYTILKQLKSVSTYVFFILIFIVSGLIMWGSFSMIKNVNQITDFNNLEADMLKKIGKGFLLVYKSLFYLLFMLFFPVFIAIKSLSIYRGEMDDGTLLILSSMPFTRLKLIFQKWLSLQVICLFFTLIAIFVSPVFFLSIKGFSEISQEFTKVLFENSFSIILASIIFQVLISTFAVFLSLFFGKVGTTAFITIFSFILLILYFLPSMLIKRILDTNVSTELYIYTSKLGELSDKSGLFQHYSDSDLKDLFELENWYTNQELENHKYVGKRKFNLTFEPSFIVEFADLIDSKNSSDFSKKKQAFLENKEIKVVDINYNNSIPKAVQTLFELLKKVMPQTINLCPIDVEYKKNYYLENEFVISQLSKTGNYDLIKSYDEYKKSLDNNKSLTEKEKKIVNLSKSVFESFQKNYSADVNISKLTFIQHNCNTKMFVESLAKQYLQYQNIPNNNEHRYNSTVKEIIDIIINNDKKSIAYFIDNDAFQNINFLMEQLFIIIKQMNCFDVSQSDINKVDSWLKFIKINNHLNMGVQMKFIWDGENKEIVSGFSQPNYYGKWELKEINYSKQDGTQQTMKYGRLVPKSFKKMINKKVLYVVYPIISLCLISLLILMVYRKDFT